MSDYVYEKDGYVLRLAKKEDVNEYYENNFKHFNEEAARFTGSKLNWTYEEVTNHLLNSVEADDRYDFLIISPEGKIIGESVLNEIDEEVKSANFRIGIFHSEYFGQGIGSWAIKKTLEFAFLEAKLHRISLEVFSYNPRAIKAYKNAGFKEEGILRDSIKDVDGSYADIILMAILDEEWQNLNR